MEIPSMVDNLSRNEASGEKSASFQDAKSSAAIDVMT
jgi:hypothetical protein